MSIKNPLTPAGIEPATFRFVAQHLNHCATAHLNVPFLMTSVFLITNDISNERFSHKVIYAVLTKLGTFRFILTTRGVMELRRDELIILGTFEPDVIPIGLT